MDVDQAYPLVVLPPEHGALAPVSSTIVVRLGSRHDSEPDLRALLALLWRGFGKLAWLFFLALIALRRLRLQLIELRQQANYWKAQHQKFPLLQLRFSWQSIYSWRVFSWKLLTCCLERSEIMTVWHESSW